MSPFLKLILDAVLHLIYYTREPIVKKKETQALYLTAQSVFNSPISDFVDTFDYFGGINIQIFIT